MELRVATPDAVEYHPIDVSSIHSVRSSRRTCTPPLVDLPPQLPRKGREPVWEQTSLVISWYESAVPIEIDRWEAETDLDPIFWKLKF